MGQNVKSLWQTISKCNFKNIKLSFNHDSWMFQTESENSTTFIMKFNEIVFLCGLPNFVWGVLQVRPSQNFGHLHSNKFASLTEHSPLFWQGLGKQTFFFVVGFFVVAMGKTVVGSSSVSFSSKYGNNLVLCHKTFVSKLIFIGNARICHCIFRDVIGCLAFTENL